MKRILCAILAIVIAAAVFSACSENKGGASDEASLSPTPTEPAEESTMHTVYYKDSTKPEQVTAHFFNSLTGEEKAVDTNKLSGSDGSVFYCEEDTALYNMVYFTTGDEQVRVFAKVAFNKCVSGWYNIDNELKPYTQGEDEVTRHYGEKLTYDCNGYDKNVYVRTPDDYDPDSGEKYSSIYLLDGQYMTTMAEDDLPIKGHPGFIESVKAMQSSVGSKAVVIAIESDAARDWEMVPDIGDSFDEKMAREKQGYELSEEFDSMSGSELEDFISDTLVPDIQSRYSVSTDPLHTAVTGYSLGGLEAFYIAMENPDIFGSCGCLSPSFWEYEDDTWREYLGSKCFGSGSPLIWLYTGPENLDTEPHVSQMYDRLTDMGYPEDKLIMHLNKEGVHDMRVWSNVFPEFLTAMVYQRIVPLEK